MGVATGDFDNDGWVDLYLTKFDAPNQLLRNNGDGTFTDVSKASGTDQHSWSVSASFVDIDRDGWLDLFVGNYLRYRLEGNTRCSSPTGAPDYCTPDSYRGAARSAVPESTERHVRRRHDERLASPESSARRSASPPPTSMATDGWTSTSPTTARRTSCGSIGATARSRTARCSPVWRCRSSGKAEGSMGVDAGDFDNDGDDDLVMTELTAEGSNLYVNDGTGVFTDASAPSAIGPASLPFTGFGAVLARLRQRRSARSASRSTGPCRSSRRCDRRGDPFPMHQKKLLLRKAGSGRFEDVTSASRDGVRARRKSGAARRSGTWTTTATSIC